MPPSLVTRRLAAIAGAVGLLPALGVLLALLVSPHANADAAAGEEKAAACAACHGAEGISANPIWPNLAGQHSSYIAKQLGNFKAEERDNAIMYGMSVGLSDEDMIDIGDYYASLPMPTGTASDRELAAAGEELYRAGNAESGVAACMACHGAQGKGIPAAAWPALSGQHRDYVVAQLQAFRGAHRANDPNGMMRGVARYLSDGEIEALAEYIVGLN